MTISERKDRRPNSGQCDADPLARQSFGFRKLLFSPFFWFLEATNLEARSSEKNNACRMRPSQILLFVRIGAQ
jgi:hypothetical protein